MSVERLVVKFAGLLPTRKTGRYNSLHREGLQLARSVRMSRLLSQRKARGREESQRTRKNTNTKQEIKRLGGTHYGVEFDGRCAAVAGEEAPGRERVSVDRSQPDGVSSKTTAAVPSRGRPNLVGHAMALIIDADALFFRGVDRDRHPLCAGCFSSRAAGSKLRSASVSTFASLSWIPAARCDVYLPVPLEVRHLVLHVCD